MKKTKLLLAFALLAGSLVTSCDNNGSKETMSNQDIVDAVMSSSAVITNNKAAPIRDTTYNVENSLEALSGSYVVAQTNYSYLSDVGNVYDVTIDWDYDETLFKAETVSSNGSTHLQLTPNWSNIEYGTETTATIKATASYEDATASLDYDITLVSNKNLTSISNMPSSGSVAVRGYVTGFIQGSDEKSWYGVTVQAGDYGFMIYQPTKDKLPSGLKVGDCIEVLGESSPYNGTRQVKGASAVVTILSGSDAEAVESPNIVELGDAGLISQDTYGTISQITGAKVLNVEDVTNIYGGNSTEHAYIQATLEYKGKEIHFYSDRYNYDFDSKVALYDLLKEAMDSDGQKTVNLRGMQAMNKVASIGEDGTTSDKTDSSPALMFVGLDGCEINNEPYVEVTPVDITYTGNLFVGGTLTLNASVNGETGVEFVWTSSNENVAKVDETGKVTGVGEGNVIITATSKEDPSITGVVRLSCVERQGEPEYIAASVSEVLDAENSKAQAYVVRGVIKGIGTSGTDEEFSKYGNLVLADENNPETTITVYGLSAVYTDLSFDDATGEYSFHNSAQFTENANTKDLKVGDLVSMVAIRADYQGTEQLNGVLVATNDTRLGTPTKATLEEVLNGAPLTTNSSNTSGQYLYEVTATIKEWAKGEATEYGDMIVTDETGTEIAVYGATAQTNAISYNYKGNGKYSIGNPKDWLTNDATKDLKIGDKITFTCVRSDYQGTAQIVCDSVRKA